jgi:dihydrofolate reductase
MAIMTAERYEATELVVCGGAQTYAAAMEQANTLMLTRVHTNLGQGIAFPAIHEEDGWEVIERREHPADQRHAFAMTFLTLHRHLKPIRRR